MSDVAVFLFGAFVTVLCSAAVVILVYGAAQEREDEIAPGRLAATKGKETPPLERVRPEPSRIAAHPGAGS